MWNRKSICIISFSPIYRDARVLRQIKYLSVNYNLFVIGFGPPHKDWVNRNDIKWISIENQSMQGGELASTDKLRNIIPLLKSRLPNSWITESIQSIIQKLKLLLNFFILGLGRISPKFYEVWYWKPKYRLKALKYATQSGCYAFHANDWEALPLAAKAAESLNAKIIFDAHEYAPLELENRWYWKPLFQPMINYFLKKYLTKVDSFITVAPAISQRYKKEFGLNSQVILNVPEIVFLKRKFPNANKIQLVHHGGAVRDRKLENLIKTLALCDKRFDLNFILLNNDSKYIESLMDLSKSIAPGRVKFHEPVISDKIVERISEYDIGFYLLEPNSFNNIAALPNKFFDFIAAGLAICIGPSPSMAKIIKQYGCGCIAPSFEPRIVADTLNKLTMDDILKMKEASRKASKYLNAEKEMKKLLNLYNEIIK